MSRETGGRPSPEEMGIKPEEMLTEEEKKQAITKQIKNENKIIDSRDDAEDLREMKADARNQGRSIGKKILGLNKTSATDIMREEATEMNKEFDQVRQGEISEEDFKKKASEREVNDSRDRALYHQEIRVKVRDHGRSIGKKIFGLDKSSAMDVAEDDAIEMDEEVKEKSALEEAREKLKNIKG